MLRLLFEKTGNMIWISHLDLMRLFQRAFKRAGLPLTHTQGFNPRPSVSIALPLSVGVESRCELLDFELCDESLALGDICTRLNEALLPGLRVLRVYDNGRKLRELTRLRCEIYLEYDDGIPEGALDSITSLLKKGNVVVPKKTKNGIVEQDICPMIYQLSGEETDGNTLKLTAVVACQNPTLNPMQIPLAVETYLPKLTPSFSRCCRLELLDSNNDIFR